MKKFLWMWLVGGLGALLVAGDLLAATAIKVPARIEVSTAHVTLGDIFIGVDQRIADKIVVQAPPKGHEVIIPITWIVRVASTYDINWSPSPNRTTMITIYHLTQNQQQVRLRDDLTRMIKRSLAQNNDDEPVQTVPRETGDVSEEHRLQIPVLVRATRPGEIITRDDLQWRTLPKHVRAPRSIQSMDEIIGKTPVRWLSAGRALQSHQFKNPPVVERGEVVTVIIRHKSLRITTSGRALESGAIGEVIDVINASSKKTIQAEVIGRGQAQVTLPSSLLAQNDIY
ncbi:MAG: flagellar basal body P-ring formation chaperone FlgA [Pseudomonadota bacterium]